MYPTEYLLRSDNPNLIKELGGIAVKKYMSVNMLINSILAEVIKKDKKN